MEITLEGEVKERESLAKQLKRAEKALNDAAAELADAQESEDALKTQVGVCVLQNLLKRKRNLLTQITSNTSEANNKKQLRWRIVLTKTTTTTVPNRRQQRRDILLETRCPIYPD